jgi:predicted nucleic acid-binding protein
MNFVLDASVAVKWVLPEADSANALRLRDAYRQGVHGLAAPDSFPVEVAHALTRAERKKLLLQSEATIKLADIFSTGPSLHAYLPLLPRAVELSSQQRTGVFDCLYVALAGREQCKVVSADQRMIALFPAHVISLASF